MTVQYFFFDTYLGKFLQVIPIAVLAGLVYAVLRRRSGKRLASCRGLAGILFACYLVGLLVLTVVPSNLLGEAWYWLFYRQDGGMSGLRLFTFEYNLIPDFYRHFTAENLDNIALYLPIGLFLPLLWEKLRGWRVPAVALGGSFCIEVFQLFVGRSFDVNDLVLNTAGAAVGYFLFLMLRRVFPHFVERCREK